MKAAIEDKHPLQHAGYTLHFVGKSAMTAGEDLLFPTLLVVAPSGLTRVLTRGDIVFLRKHPTAPRVFIGAGRFEHAIGTVKAVQIATAFFHHDPSLIATDGTTSRHALKMEQTGVVQSLGCPIRVTNVSFLMHGYQKHSVAFRFVLCSPRGAPLLANSLAHAGGPHAAGRGQERNCVGRGSKGGGWGHLCPANGGLVPLVCIRRE